MKIGQKQCVCAIHADTFVTFKNSVGNDDTKIINYVEYVLACLRQIQSMMFPFFVLLKFEKVKLNLLYVVFFCQSRKLLQSDY